MSSEAVKRELSGSVDGKGIVVGSGSPSDTVIHEAVVSAVAGTYDEIWLFGYNSHTSDVVVTIEWGDDVVPRVITLEPGGGYKGLIPLIPGLLLRNTNVVARASVPNVVIIDGFVHRITD
jgi:hypothetical protein